MDLAHEALKMAGALALVVVLLLGGLVWVRRVGAGKQIMLVEIAGEVLVLGTTAREMTLLTTIADADRIHRLRSIANPVVGRLGVWFGQWNRQVSEKAVAGSFTTKSPIDMSKCV